MDRRKFIQNSIIACAGCALTYGLFSRTSFLKHTENNIPFDEKFKGLDVLSNVDIHLVEHCNLKCKYCCHFSCIAEEEYLDVSQYEKDIKQFAKITEQRVRHIYLMGGEPLLHPEINKICEITRHSFPLSEIEVLTNGILLNSMSDEFWKMLHNNSIFIKKSIYPVEIINLEQHYEKAKKFNVKITPSFEDAHKPIDSFFVYDLHLNGDVDYIARFRNCPACLKSDWSCGQLYKGKLYQCHTEQGIRHFNKKFGKNITVTDDDTLDIYQAKNYDDIMKYKYKPLAFCKYCGFCDIEKPWEQSEEHDISEWTYDVDV